MISVSIKETFEKTFFIEPPEGMRDEQQLITYLKKVTRDNYQSGKLYLKPEDCKSIEVSIDNGDYQRFCDMCTDLDKEEENARD